ncbi:Cyclic AMP-responsive element-binding protein 5, partial [Galemys pyrenaicus]
RFPTEDHLMIHRHKHEMTLKFPSIKTDNMLSDQTPTPTRFLKNCEEVGLFNELDCSLEHEFRKAQEEESSKRAVSTSLYTLSSETHPLSQLAKPHLDNAFLCLSVNLALGAQASALAVTDIPL